MIVPLTTARLSAALPYPGGAVYRNLPLMKAVVESSGKQDINSFLIDTGADSIVFPLSVAQRLGIDLTGAPTGTAATASGTRMPIQYAQVTITLAHGFTNCRWETWAGFGAVRHWLFGHFGGLEHFHFTLDAGGEEFILVPRDTLPRI